MRDGGGEHGVQFLRGVGQRGVRADRDALHALGAVLGDVERRFAAGDVLRGRVAGGRCDHAHGRERRGGLVVAELERNSASKAATLAMGCAYLSSRRQCGAAAGTARSAGGGEFKNGQQRLAAEGRLVGSGDFADGDFLHRLLLHLLDF